MNLIPKFEEAVRRDWQRNDLTGNDELTITFLARRRQVVSFYAPNDSIVEDIEKNTVESLRRDVLESARDTCHNIHEPPRNTTFWPVPHFRCSKCGKAHVSMDYVFFCPNCGAEVTDES